MADVIIVGAGPAGLTAGLYLGRGGNPPLILEALTPGGTPLLTDRIENFPGFPEGITGWELMERMKNQAEKYGAKIISAEATAIRKKGNFFEVSAQKPYESRSVIIATGSDYKKLSIPGEDKFMGKGVSFCATCDAAFFKDKEVAVIGGGDSALSEADYLTKFASKVFVIHRRDQFRAEDALVKTAKENPKIKFILSTVAEEFLGEKTLEKILLRNVSSGEKSELPVSGVFVAVGRIPHTGFLKGFLELDEGGYIITTENCRTSVEGVFACGDCRKNAIGQIISACSDGAVAALNAEKFLSMK